MSKLKIKNNLAKNHIEYYRSRDIYIIYIIGITILILLIITLSPIGHNFAFYSKWVSCGHKPLQIGTAYKNPVAWYENARVFEFFRPSANFFCTPLEAEQAGYSANQSRYEFPELNKLQDQSSH